MEMERKPRSRTSVAFTLSIIFHGILAIALTLYILVEKEILPNPFAAEMVAPPPPPKPTVRKPEVKQLPKPVVLTETPVVQQVVQTRVTTAANIKTSNVQAETVLEYAPKVVQVNAPINPVAPRVVNPRVEVPQVVTHADLPVQDSPDALAFSAPVAGTGIGTGPKIGRSVVGSVQVARAFQGKHAGISLVEHVGAELEGIGEMAVNLKIGAQDVLPLPKGEPGGRVVGRGKDIKGVFRLVRVKHNLSDWWADQSSLNALAKWLNEKTQIKTDLNVEGGAVQLSDANLLKSPLLWMTGHDPALVQQRSLIREGGGGKLDNRLSDLEAKNLRTYLTEKQGLLVFDDCGVNAPAQAMIKIFQAQMRLVMPEYGIERLPNDHPIYHTFYELNGPPIGFDIFWWGTRPPKRNYLEGISVGDKLVAMMIRRDYMCAMEAVNLPTRSVNYSPGVYRWATNVVVYSLTTGNIADYSDYIPEDTLAQKEVPLSAPQSARITSQPIPLEE
ncbi:MAG: hypothetical protein KatS3mg115_1672 [Candidatus Poribacteria bacterium]|nr:MAG: hypothetical protein KatS3mg115_1672 [Candidatus Poribacteria bacterium]